MKELTATVNIRDDMEATVYGTYYPFEEGQRDHHGAAIEPDYEERIEIDSVEDEAGLPIELEPAEEGWAIYALWNELSL